jgi:hypothetical protein
MPKNTSINQPNLTPANVEVEQAIITRIEQMQDSHQPQNKRLENVKSLIINQIKRRRDVGRAKYGTTMERTDLMPSEWCQHLLEELLDAAIYCERLKRDAEKLESSQIPKLGLSSACRNMIDQTLNAVVVFECYRQDLENLEMASDDGRTST